MSEKVQYPSTEAGILYEEHKSKAAAAKQLGDLATSEHNGGLGLEPLEDGRNIAYWGAYESATPKIAREGARAMIATTNRFSKDAQPHLAKAAESAEKDLAQSDKRAGEIVTNELDEFIVDAQIDMEREKRESQNQERQKRAA